MRKNSLSQSFVSSHHHSFSASASHIKPLLRKRSSHPVNLTQVSTSTLSTPALTALRQRHRGKPKGFSPELASQLVASYLLPMFETEKEGATELTRSFTYGAGKLPLNPLPGTVYGELKLSASLGKELGELREELQSAKAKLRESEQAAASALSQLHLHQDHASAFEGHLRALIIHSRIDTNRVQTATMTEDSLKQDLRKLLASYTQLEEANKASHAQLQEQDAIIDKLRNRAIEQEHINSLLIMENDIIGERLKGLYFAIEKVADNLVLETHCRDHFDAIYEGTKELIAFTTSIRIQLRDSLYERDALKADNTEMVINRNEMRAERDKLAKVAKDKITELQGNLQKAEDEREKLQGKLEEAEHNSKDLTEEYEKLRQKAKQYKMRRKQFGEEEEKVCRHCQKVFIESENFNWSCRRHPNEYSGEIYWCCGKSSRDAIGCKTSKHESKEDEDEEKINKEGPEQSALMCAVSAIQSCKKYGHTATDCPRDPNPRSTHDVFDEVSRIKTIYQAKKKGDDQLVCQQALDMLIDRNTDCMFNQMDADSESSQSGSVAGEEEEVLREKEFHDIRKIKAQLEFDPSQVRLYRELPHNRYSGGTGHSLASASGQDEQAVQGLVYLVWWGCG